MWLRSRENYSEEDFINIYIALLHYKNLLSRNCLEHESVENVIKKISNEVELYYK